MGTDMIHLTVVTENLYSLESLFLILWTGRSTGVNIFIIGTGIGGISVILDTGVEVQELQVQMLEIQVLKIQVLLVQVLEIQVLEEDNNFPGLQI